MSTLATTNIKHASSSSNNIVLGSDGTSYIPGHIVQVKQTVKTDEFSTTSTSAVDVTGLSVSITPTSTSSKILVTYDVKASCENVQMSFFLLRDSFLIDYDLLINSY